MKSVALCLLVALAGCGKHPGAYTSATDAAVSPADAAVAEADALWAERVDEAKLTAALAKYEEVLALDPTNRHAYQMLTRGWYFWGDSYTTDKDVQVERWGKAIEFGTKCLALNPAFAQVIAEGGKEKDAVSTATKDDVPCLYWTSSALGKWGKAQGLAKTLKHLPTVKAFMTKVEELEPEYWHFGPARYWGAYYSALPSFAGQDFDKSAASFETSIKGAPDYLGTYVLRAEFLAVPTKNVAQFDADIAHVLAADPAAHPEFLAESTREQEKAKALQAKRADLFSESAIEAAAANP